MANIVKYNTRVQLKYDSLTEWNKVKTSFIPLKGEVCVVDPSEDLGSGSTIALLKVGDGVKTFDQLDYVCAPAADVPGWAKLPPEQFTELLDKGTLTYGGNTYTCTSFATDAELEVVAGKVTELENQLPGIAESIDTLGNSLKSTGSTLKTITKIEYNADTNEATITYDDIQLATTNQKGVVQLSDATNSNESTTAATSKAVKSAYDLADEANAAATSAGTAAGNAQDTADEALEKANANATAIAGMDLPKVGDSSKALQYIQTISQTDGKVTATVGTIPDANASTKGVVLLGATNGAATYARVEELAGKITSVENKITNAMHFLGSTTTEISDGATTATISIGGKNTTLTAADAGAVVLYGGYEYVWVGNAWEQLGQEGSFAVKGSIENSDIADNAGITQTKIASTLGKTNLAGDISDLNTRLGTTEGDIDSLEGAIASHKSYATIKGTSGTTTAAVINDEVSIVGDGKITTAVTADTVTINHAGPGTATETVGNTTAESPDHGESFDVIGEVRYDATGHIVSANTKTITLPEAYDDSELRGQIAAIKSFSKVNSVEADGVNDTLTIANGTAITVTDDKTNDKITIAHADVSRTDGTSTTLSPAHEGIFTIVESVTTNDQGHVTKVQPRTIKLPKGYDDSVLAGRVTELETLEKTTWKTSSVATVAETATTAQKASLAASDLTIGETEIGYIIFDCGSATKNV